MTLEVFSSEFSVCKFEHNFPLPDGMFFLANTDREISLVCETRNLLASTPFREDGWRCFRVSGELEFSLIGILAKITAVLANAGISVFCVSTFDTDYVLVKSDRLEPALHALQGRGYDIKYL